MCFSTSACSTPLGADRGGRPAVSLQGARPTSVGSSLSWCCVSRGWGTVVDVKSALSALGGQRRVVAWLLALCLGLEFRTSQAGFITGIRFYKSSANTGTHTGTLWSRTGTRLATATFAGESGSGWQQVNFASPVAVSANTTYVASYFTPVGHYSVDENYFASAATTRGPLTALANGTDGANGVYRYGASGFPSSSYRSSNYWVDTVFTTN